MRTILSLLSGIRAVQMEAKGVQPTRVQEMREMYRFIDTALSGVRINNGGGWDGPESKLGEAMISADFTYAIMEFVQRRMEPSYTQRRFDFEQFIAVDTVPNFLPVTRYQSQQVGLDDLEYVAELGEARVGSVNDATKRQYRVYRFEKAFEWSMEALVNDDLGYFTDVAERMGRSARRSYEKFASRMYTNATSIARLVALGALYSTTGRLTTSRISDMRMAFKQRTDAAGEPINANMRYLVHHPGLEDTVETIRGSQLVPENANNAANVVAGKFTPIEDPYMPGTAPNLPWFGFTDYREDNIKPLVLARRNGVPGPMILRKKSDIEAVTALDGSGASLSPMMGDFATGSVVLKVHDEWGCRIDATDGNLYDTRGAYYSSGTVA